MTEGLLELQKDLPHIPESSKRFSFATTERTQNVSISLARKSLKLRVN
jgi:hypothetical protein